MRGTGGRLEGGEEGRGQGISSLSFCLGWGCVFWQWLYLLHDPMIPAPTQEPFLHHTTLLSCPSSSFVLWLIPDHPISLASQLFHLTLNQFSILNFLSLKHLDWFVSLIGLWVIWLLYPERHPLATSSTIATLPPPSPTLLYFFEQHLSPCDIILYFYLFMVCLLH